MKKRILCALLGVCLCFGAALPLTVSAAERNLFQNGTMNRGITGWSTWTNDPSGCTFSFSKDGGVDGTGCLKIENTKQVAASFYQMAGLKQGKTYIMTADVRCENVSTEGSGFILGMAMYDAAGNNIGEMSSSSRFGTSTDWSTVTFIFTVSNENCVAASAGPRLWFSTGTVYVDNVSVKEIVKEPAQSKTYDLTVSDTPNRFTVDALSCEWDPKLLLPCNLEKGVTEDDLTLMKENMDKLGLHAVRMMIMPEWFEPANDNVDPAAVNSDGFKLESDEIKTTLAYLKVCHELGIKVTLTWWGAGAGTWLAFPNCNDWISAPNSKEEIAENISWFIGYVKNELKYDCIYNVILMNEPSYAFHVEGGAVDFPYYVECYKAIRARLDADGLTDIRLVGSDDAQSLGWFCNSYTELLEVCDAFNSHNYAWTYDMPYLNQMVGEFVSARTQFGGEKPFFMGEFGDGTSVGAYYAQSVETYGRGLYLASFAVNALGAGAAGMSYWGLHDVYYYINDQGGDNGGLMETGLIGYKTDGAWKYRPSYYAWGLICNYIPFGSEVYRVTGETDDLIDCIAVKTLEGKWSFITVNRSDVEQTVKINTSAAENMNLYLFSESTLPTDNTNEMIPATKAVAAKDGGYTVTVPAWSFTVLSNVDEVTLPVEGETTPAETDPNPETTPADETTDGTAPTESTPVTPDTNTPDSDTQPTEKKGCGSALTLTAGLLPASLAAAWAVIRKRKEE
ncbi:MAG: carbohydrate binding domain-containing protein [Clostridia bacterium]|nr:carbohydrate binding domain-containing protein [Clostridia bacterium]